MQDGLVSCANMPTQNCKLPWTDVSSRTMNTGWPLYHGGQLGPMNCCVSAIFNASWTHSHYWGPTSSVLPHKRHIESLLHLTPAEKLSFAELLSNVTIRYDNLFSCSFPYSMGIHQRPVPVSYDVPSIEDNMNVAHLHVHFTPPLLRSADVKKFLVG